MKADVEVRSNAWHSEFRPRLGWQEYAFTQFVLTSIKMDRCQKNVNAAINDYGARASTSWEEDRKLEAAVTAAKLADQPEWISRQLQTTRHGCELMIDRWDQLGRSLRSSGEWKEAERSLALDLIGLLPSLRDGQTSIDASEGADPLAHQLAFVSAEIERLEEVADRLADLDANARASARATYGAELTKPVQLLLRYEREATKGFHGYLNELRRELSEPTATLSAPPAPPKPVPLPPRTPTPLPAPVRDPESSLTYRDVAEAGFASAIAIRRGSEFAPVGVSVVHSCHAGGQSPNRRDRRAVKALSRRG